MTDAERLKAIAGKLNGIANAMAATIMPDYEQFHYWRKAVEEAYDLARKQHLPQPEQP